MNASDLLDEIFKNCGDAGSTVSKQMEAYAKNIVILENALKSQYEKGYKAGKKEGQNQSVQNLIKKN